MRAKQSRLKGAVGALAMAVAAVLVIAPGASAHTGAYAKFNYCPSTNSAVFKCLYSVTTSGKVVLGKKTVPIVNPVVLQGGFSVPNEEFVSSFVGATNGNTLSKAAQPVPGGLTGLINCKEISVGWLRSSCEAVFENGLTGVNSTLELARPASEIQISELGLIAEEGVALRLPVKVHLENPLLGSSCYVGSSASPLIWNLTTGTTKPPAGTAPIHGSGGTLSFQEGGEILHLANAELVENNWAAPHATGCGGFLAELILDPILDSQVGLPAAAGKNVADLVTQNDVALAETVNAH